MSLKNPRSDAEITLMAHGRVFRFRTITEQYRNTIGQLGLLHVTLQFSLKCSLLRTQYLQKQNNVLSVNVLSNARISEKI